VTTDAEDTLTWLTAHRTEDQMIPTPRRSLLAFPLATALLLGACSQESSDQTAAEPTAASPTVGSFTLAPHTVTTDLGDVAVPQDPQTIVVLNHALAGYLYDVGAPVTAVTSQDTSNDETYGEFWADDAQTQGTTFVPWGDNGFNLEVVASLQPDLIIGGGVGFPQRLAQLGYEDLSAIAPTVVVPATLTTWQEQFEFLADDVFERPEVYDQALTDYEDRVQEVAAVITPPTAPSVVMSVTADQRPYVLIEDQGLPTVLEQVGIEPAPLFASGRYEPYTAGGDSFEVSAELLGSVVTQPTVFVIGFNGAAVDVATLARNPVFAALPSFTAGTAYDLPSEAYRGDYDETMHLLDVLEEMFA